MITIFLKPIFSVERWAEPELSLLLTTLIFISKTLYFEEQWEQGQTPAQLTNIRPEVRGRTCITHLNIINVRQVSLIPVKSGVRNWFHSVITARACAPCKTSYCSSIISTKGLDGHLSVACYRYLLSPVKPLASPVSTSCCFRAGTSSLRKCLWS